MTEASAPKHDLNQVWTAINKTQGQVSALSLAFENLSSDVKQLLQVVTRPASPTNWIGIGTLVIALIITSATYIQARLSPIDSVITKHDGYIMEELKASSEHRYNAGLRDGKLDTLATVVETFFNTTHERLIGLEEKSTSNEARAEVNEQRLTDVDERGSRKWVRDSQ